jgi:S1/P1 Nuclease
MMPSSEVLRVPSSISVSRRISWPRNVLRAGIFVGLLLVAVISLPAPARAWGCEGHQVVALLAEKHLTPHALAMAKEILAEGPIDPTLSRYCKEGGADPLADASTWPDDIRGLRPETPPWHYIDIPRGTTTFREIEKFCDPKEGCVTRAITDQLAILRSSETDPRKRADALRFLIHFVGDVHQPLHAITNNDEGGNCVPVAFFDALPQVRNPQTESYAPNLHAVWDTNILARSTTGKTVDQVAADLDQSLHSNMTRWQKGRTNIDGWAWESYQLAMKNVYGKLPVRIPVETPQPIKSCSDDNHVSARLLKLNERLVDPYQNMAIPIVWERLAQAGARLAMLLNQIWP